MSISSALTTPLTDRKHAQPVVWESFQEITKTKREKTDG
jgi:hypothetical protein